MRALHLMTGGRYLRHPELKTPFSIVSVLHRPVFLKFFFPAAGLSIYYGVFQCAEFEYTISFLRTHLVQKII